jgi:nitroimidazol reductase NimA-like FMN-containing flavoprotein (pyridoxamine 5'-phosphate oxidase superfamily)
MAEAGSDSSVYDLLATRAAVGHVGILTPDGYPRVVPVNFATVGDRVYFHGASSGEKYDAFAARQKVTFSIDLPYSAIPSHWRSDNYACPASQFFRSVLIRGRGVIVEDTTEKASALQTLMERHQAEGGFERITSDNPLYSKALADVTVFRIDPVRIDVREKFGDQLSRETRLQLIDKLKERDHERDRETALEMEKRIDRPTSGKEAK